MFRFDILTKKMKTLSSSKMDLKELEHIEDTY
jgi:hypothetical protein